MVSIGAEWHQGVSALECQNEELVRYIETMEREHKEERTKFNEYMDKIQRCFQLVRYIETMEREHKEERTKFNEYMDKIQRCFLHVEKLLLRLCNGSDRKHVNGEMG